MEKSSKLFLLFKNCTYKTENAHSAMVNEYFLFVLKIELNYSKFFFRVLKHFKVWTI